jgi:hypothetical protein
VSAGTIALCDYFDPDNSRKLLVYPASWPGAVGEEPNVLTWLMLSQGAGFNGGTLTIRLSGPDGLTIRSGAANGFKFHNGQLVGALDHEPTGLTLEQAKQLAESKNFTLTEQSCDRGTKTFTASLPNLKIPAMKPERTTQIIAIVQLYVETHAPGEWKVAGSLQPGADSEYCHPLPSVRIAPKEQKWVPVVSGLSPKTTYDKRFNLADDYIANQWGRLDDKLKNEMRIRHCADYTRELEYRQKLVAEQRLLDHPAISSNIAILKDEAQSTLDACHAFTETWISPFLHMPGEARVLAEKHMTRSASVSKTRKALAFAELRGDKLWKKLFDVAGNYQTVFVDFTPQGSLTPIGGFGLQASLQTHLMPNIGALDEGVAQTLSLMRGIRFDPMPAGSTFHLSHWVINHPSCYESMKTSVVPMKAQLDAFCAMHKPLQAWFGQNTWIPRFDQANNYERTVYENFSALNWFRGVCGATTNLNDRKMTAQWCSNVLRMVTPHMWLGQSLIEQVDQAALARAADVTQHGDMIKIELRETAAIDDLELALLPILPVESAKITILAEARTA